jgi:dUTP pyrophosphatase
MKIKIKRLHKDAVIPKYAKDGDAGLDLVATEAYREDVATDEGNYGYDNYKTGLAFEIPEGHVGLLFPRSSISNTGHILSNSVGVIDSGYRGEVSMRFKTVPGSRQYKPGDKVGQLIVMPYPQVEFEEVEELSDSERGAGAYGSSGR